MKYQLKLQKAQRDFYWAEYLLMLLMVLEGTTVFSVSVSTIFNLTINFLILVVTAGMCFFLLMTRSLWKQECIKYTFWLLSWVICMTLFLAFNHDDYKMFILRFIIFVPLIVFYLTFSKSGFQSLLEKYTNLIVIITVISLLFWLFGSVLGKIHANSTLLIDWGTKHIIPSYYGIYFETQKAYLFSHIEVIRNSAIFPEAPIFSFHLSVALLTTLLYSNKKINHFKLTVLSIGIITSISFTGIILCIAVLSINYLLKTNSKRRMVILKWILLFIGAVFAFWLILLLLKIKSQSSSYSIRLDDYRAAFLAWKEHPFFGVGFNNFDAIKNFMSLSRKYNMGFSNSIMQVLAQGGLYLFSVYLYLFILHIRCAAIRHSMNHVLFISSIFYLYCTTTFAYNYLFVFLLFSGESEFIRCKYQVTKKFESGLNLEER